MRFLGYCLIMNDCEITAATTREDIAHIRALFMEYQQHLDVDLDFQCFGEELAELPGKYAPPDGQLLIARHEGKVAGFVAICPLEGATCELKRHFVRRDFANKGIGKALIEAAIAEAQAIGYRFMRLDTLRRFKEAAKLYAHYDFYEIERYNDNPHADVYYMEREL